MVSVFLSLSKLPSMSIGVADMLSNHTLRYTFLVSVVSVHALAFEAQLAFHCAAEPQPAQFEFVGCGACGLEPFTLHGEVPGAFHLFEDFVFRAEAWAEPRDPRRTPVW